MNNRYKADFYTVKAKKSGYPARSVFKLEEIQKKWKIIKNNSTVLDVGASPGSWSLYVLRNLKNTKVVAVDIKPLEIEYSGSDRFEFYMGNIFSDEAEKFLSLHAPYNCILSDAAPRTTGNRLVDTSESFSIASGITDIAAEHLIRGGCFIMKIFQGGDEKIIFKRLKGMFKNVKAFKPKAVRKNSMEIYFIGIEYGSV